MPLLELEAFGVDIGETSPLGSISFKLARAQSVGIVGAAGAGKTLLALALGSLLPAGARRSGQLLFDGNPLPIEEAILARLRGRRFGFLFGDRIALDPRASVGAQLRATRKRYGEPFDDKAIAEALAECSLAPETGGKFAHELDAGTARQVLLALALAGNPDLLVADEPSAGLDPVATRALLDLLSAIPRKREIALLLLSRDPRVVAATCNDLMILKRGRIVETGTPSQAFALPQHEHTRALVVAGKARMRTLTRSPIGIDFVTVRGLRLTSNGPDLDFAIRRGESLAIVGRPGSGKSRIGRIVAGLKRAAKGLLVFEHDMYHGDDLPLHRRREVSFVFPTPSRAFDPRLPIGTSLTEPLRLEPRLLIEEQAERLVELVRSVGLDPDTLSALPAAFSHEELGRFAIARALIARPLLLILDDPLAGLDVEQRAERLALIGRLRSDYGLTLLLLLDDLEVARILADRALILKAGQIVEEGSPGAMIEAPRQPLTEALVAARLSDVGALPPGMVVE